MMPSKKYTYTCYCSYLYYYYVTNYIVEKSRNKYQYFFKHYNHVCIILALPTKLRATPRTPERQTTVYRFLQGGLTGCPGRESPL